MGQQPSRILFMYLAHLIVKEKANPQGGFIIEVTTMFHSLIKIFTRTCLIFLTIFPIMSIAGQNQAGSGVIHIRGKIVESPCNVNSQQGRLALSCAHEGQQQTRVFSPHEVAKASQHFKQLASVQMTYLNEKKNLAVITMEYR